MKTQYSLSSERIENIEDALWLAACIAEANGMDPEQFAENIIKHTPSTRPDTPGSVIQPPPSDRAFLHVNEKTDISNKSKKNVDTTAPLNVYSGTTAKTSKRSQVSFLSIQRALRPLKLKVPNYSIPPEIDVKATLYRFAEDRLRSFQQDSPSLPELRVALPIMRPALERWLDLVLVIDQWSTMKVFDNKVQLFCNAVEQSGIFRRIYKYELDCVSENSNPALYFGEGLRKKMPVTSKTLISDNSSRVIVFISDCMSPLWDTWLEKKGIGQLMRELGNNHPVAILQTLPDDLWLRTGLSFCEFGEVTATKMASPNKHLESVPLLPNDPDMPVPVLTFEPETIMAWARLIGGKVDTTVLAAFIPTKDLMDVDVVQDSQRIIENFLATAPTQAQHLAACFAVVPELSLEKYKHFQNYCIPNVDPNIIAELITGGIINITNGDIGIPTKLDQARTDLSQSISNVKKLETMRFFYETCSTNKFANENGLVEDFWFFFDNRDSHFDKSNDPSLERFENLVNTFFPIPVALPGNKVVTEDELSQRYYTDNASILEDTEISESKLIPNERELLAEKEEDIFPSRGELIRSTDLSYLNLPTLHIGMWGGSGAGKTS
ncbi:hypothetical protein IT418_02405, partial [bacterium]|nr:hypothetical protein [bacterium]